MPSLEVQVDDRQLQETLEALAALEPGRLMQDEGRDFAQDVIMVTGMYPPPLPTSRRTGQLGRSWYHQVMGLDVDIKNLAPYAGYVHGDEQTFRHRLTGWKRLRDEIENALDRLIERLERRAEELWR